MLTKEFFINNRKKLQNLIGDGLIIITASGLMQRNNDCAYPFRQDSNFYYLTGLEEANYVLVIDSINGEEFLIASKLSDVEIYFGGTTNRDKIAKTSGIMSIYSHKEGWARIISMRQNRKKIYTIKPAPVKFTRQESLFTSPARKILLEKIKRTTNAQIVFLSAELISLRSIKTPEEVSVIKEAIKITKAGFLAVKNNIKPGQYEYNAEAELDYVFKNHNSRHGYGPPIIAGGKNATILHYHQNNEQLKSEDLLLMDVGAEKYNYSADISRTYKLHGPLTSRQKAVYMAVETVHHKAIDLLKPALSWRDYMIEVDRLMGIELLKLKLITSNTRDQVRPYFPHGVSHSLGLDVHDICDYTKPIDENMVITVEPGIYIPEEGIGVRIEDDVLITNNGALNLSADIPYV